MDSTAKRIRDSFRPDHNILEGLGMAGSKIRFPEELRQAISADAVAADGDDDDRPDRPDQMDETAFAVAYGAAWALECLAEPFATPQQVGERARAAAASALRERYGDYSATEVGG